MRVRKPVLEKPVMLSSVVPLADDAFVPPEAIGSGPESPVMVPPVIVGDVIVGDVARTGPPLPVAALANPVATPVPSPDTPVETGRPVPFDRVTAEGVPRLGVTRVGEFDRTTEPVPVEVVDPLPPFAGVSGFCNVSELNVGEGNVWASADSGIMSAAIMIFFI